MPTRKKKRRRKGEVDIAVSRLRTVIVLLVLFSLGFSIFVSAVHGSGVMDVALPLIERAESAVDAAYQAVLEAEKAGADVSSLLDTLNAGAEALSEAYMADRAGEFDDVVHYADLCYDLVGGVETEANVLRDEAAAEQTQRIFLASLGSAIAVGCIFFAGFYGWRFFKSWYYRRFSQMKPEVVDHES
ncbi:MAG: hypothetical protein JSV85_02530 [Candidatus Bathyarchaeota archaeon]|nr:MAG: hypothetical protein JSV85_02530 [Candidatus Bathyarchaeota archaeon]